MEWLRTDVFIFRYQSPNYIEEDHLMVMGHREDNRVYYAFIPIPERPESRVEAYKTLKTKFISFLKEPPTTEPCTAIDYGLLVEDTLKRHHGFVLDSFPDGK
jgi:hypothetical protein